MCPIIGHDKEGTSPLFIPKVYNFGLIMREQQRNSNGRTSSNMADYTLEKHRHYEAKEKLRKCPTSGQAKET